MKNNGKYYTFNKNKYVDNIFKMRRQKGELENKKTGNLTYNIVK